MDFSQSSVVLHTGVFVADYGLKQETPLTGVMLFASYLTSGHRLRDYPTPLLTISGDLDGLTRITRIVETFEYVLFTVHVKENCLISPFIICPPDSTIRSVYTEN